MGTLSVILVALFAASLGLFAYVGWSVDRRRKAMRHIFIEERRYLRRVMMVATVVLVAAVAALGSALLARA